ncbi:glycosyltransferase family 8 protein, partial [Ascoidea rubescens DSM 1968]
VWMTLVTNENYLPGLLNLNYSLQRVKSKYHLIILLTPNLFESKKTDIRQKLIDNLIDLNKIIIIDHLKPKYEKSFDEHDSRFNDCWTKLKIFKLIQFNKIIFLDSDMLVLKNMDELFDDNLINIDNKKLVFSSTHACACNPLKLSHYPDDWIPKSCAYTHYYENFPKLSNDNDNDNDNNNNKIKDLNEVLGPVCNSGVKMCNGGLLIIKPSLQIYQMILDTLNDYEMTKNYDFPDQSLLSDIFQGKWLPLSYKYNALKTLKLVHPDIWNWSQVKNVHYIMNPKPWNINESELN